MYYDLEIQRKTIAKAVSSATTAKRRIWSNVGDGMGHWTSGALCTMK
jgi:hypothetical protein